VDLEDAVLEFLLHAFGADRFVEDDLAMETADVALAADEPVALAVFGFLDRLS